MPRYLWTGITIMVSLVCALCFNPGKGDAMNIQKPDRFIALPSPSLDSETSIEFALQHRRSVRSYKPDPLSIEDLAQLLWAAQGITSSQKFRTAPSAGALYPLEVYVVCSHVKDLSEGIYRYDVHQHHLELVRSGDYRDQLTSAGLGQGCIRQAPAVIVLTGIASRITGKYGQRGIQFMMMEAGHAAQNICLQAVARNLGTVPVGAFKEDRIRQVLQIDDTELPLYLLPVGNR